MEEVSGAEWTFDQRNITGSERVSALRLFGGGDRDFGDLFSFIANCNEMMKGVPGGLGKRMFFRCVQQVLES